MPSSGCGAMRILAGDGGDNASIVVVLGIGRIGSALVAQLERAHSMRVLAAFKLAWHRRRQRAAQMEQVHSEARRIVGAGFSTGRARAGLAVVWSAGVAGFAASQEEVDREAEAFGEVLGLTERLTELAGVEVCFHMISSAGGLFEGQRRVSRRSTPRPRRPYGWLKLEEEAALEARLPGTSRRVYRASSVYGPWRAGQRGSLITALVANGLRGVETELVGRPETLRDFVWVDDLAERLAKDALALPVAGGEVRYLVSARPTSLLDVQSTVERSLGQRIPVRFAPDAWNTADMTYADDLAPHGLRRTDLETGVRRVAMHALAHGFGDAGGRAR